MSKRNKAVTFVLSLAIMLAAGFNLSSPHVKQVLSTIASAVWGS